MATQSSAEGAWIGSWRTEQKETWLNQVLVVQTWRQVRGPAGAVMCETCDLGIKWPQCHTLLFEEQGWVDMRYVWPRDVKKMLLKQARSAYWKKLAAKRQYEELKEGIWLEQALALLRKKTSGLKSMETLSEYWFWKGGWVQKRFFDIGWSDEGKCQACHKEEGHRKAQALRGQTGDPGGFQKVVAKSENLKEGGGNGKEVL